MKKIAEYTELSIPSYALCYLVNDDASGIDDDDKQNTDKYMEQFYQEADSARGHVIFNVDSQEGYFTNSPEFGLPCDCYDCTIIILA